MHMYMYVYLLSFDGQSINILLLFGLDNSYIPLEQFL